MDRLLGLTAQTFPLLAGLKSTETETGRYALLHRRFVVRPSRSLAEVSDCRGVVALLH